MEAGKSGKLYLLEAPLVVMPHQFGPQGLPLTVKQFDLKTKETQTLESGVVDFALAANGEKMLYRQGEDWHISDTKPEAKANPADLDIDDMRVFVVPRRQWAEMYHDAWRIERAFFYSPIFDGLNVKAAEKEFAHYLPGIASRDALSFLFREMMSYMSVGHMFIRGGYEPKTESIEVGQLGANYKIEHGHYRITRIFTGGKWNPDIYAPLAQPGLKVKVGDYLLAVNGKPIGRGDNIYKAFQDLANKQVTLTVGPNPTMRGSHEITVKTIPDEFQLRNTAWIVHNMKVVNKLSDGRLGYVYLPDTLFNGFANFNRYFFSQVNKDGVIIDERFNHGGFLSDYIIQYLQRKPMALGVERWGKHTQVLPPMAIYGPKVMIINQFSGSGGDALPWYFKMDKIGPLVGERTWGGLVGISGYPELMDGGTITAPRYGVEGLHGKFPVENHGISPTVTVWQNPKLVRQGRDPQLERAVKIALKKLKHNPPKQYKRPPWRNYHPHLPPLPTAGSGKS
jgi:tricorn protease